MRARPALLVAAALGAAGCGRYADFTLPPPPGQPPRFESFRVETVSAPVITRGGPGEWDGVDALNPSVVRRAGIYFNFYSGYDGRCWRTGLATSDDGARWVKRGPVLGPEGAWEGDYIAANGSALLVEGEFLYWYQAGRPPRIGLARSADGRAWRKHPSAVLTGGPRGSWDERDVGDPYVIRAGGMFYMYYLGADRARRQRLGVACSGDGVRWRKLRANPILELGGAGAFDEIGLGEPAVWASHGRYWMLYTGRDRAENRHLGLAHSADGVHWVRSSGGPLAWGAEAWHSKVVCDPAVEAGEAGGAVRVWFGGGDLAHPAENIHGQIGLAVLRPMGAKLAE